MGDDSRRRQGLPRLSHSIRNIKSSYESQEGLSVKDLTEMNTRKLFLSRELSTSVLEANGFSWKKAK